MSENIARTAPGAAPSVVHPPAPLHIPDSNDPLIREYERTISLQRVSIDHLKEKIFLLESLLAIYRQSDWTARKGGDHV